MRKVFTVILLMLCVCVSFGANKLNRPYGATVNESLDNPLGVNLSNLSFSWKLDKDEKLKQSAYRIVVASTPQLLETSPIWDSGRVFSNESINIPYNGSAIKSREKLYWKVRYWDTNNKGSHWSDIKSFECGLLQNNDWQAKWISSDLPKYTPIYFRKLIDLKDSPKSARLYVACKGGFEFYINGKNIANNSLNITTSYSSKSLEYYTFDVTNLLDDDENVLSALVANAFYKGNPSVLIQLEVVYDEHNVEVFISDDSWKYAVGSLVSSEMKKGELFDGRINMSQWAEYDFDDSKWQNATAENLDENISLIPSNSSAVVEKYKMHPISINRVDDNSYIFDFGQVITAKIALKIPSNYEKPVNIEYAKSLNKDGSLHINKNSVFDTYISSSDYSSKTWKSGLSLNKFRYVKLSGISRLSKPTQEWLKASVFYNDIEDAGSFFCSDKNLNLLQNDIRWYFKNNMITSPLLKFNNSTLPIFSQLYVNSGTFNMNMASVYSKWTADMCNYILNNANTSFISNSIIVTPWKLYQIYADKKILSSNYTSMKLWVERLQNNVTASTKSTENILNFAYLYRCSDMLADIAYVLGYEADYKYYKNLSNDVRSKFTTSFISSNGVVKGEDLSSYLLVLSFNIAQDNLIELVFNNFLKRFLENPYDMNLDAIESTFLLDILTRFGHIDMAYSLLGIENSTIAKKIYPSIFDSDIKPENDDIFALKGELLKTPYYPIIGAWLYKNLAGIKLDEENIGFKNIIFAPKPPLGMSFASASYETPYGLTASYWKISDGVMEWTIIVPPNTTATVIFPTDNIRSIRLNGHSLHLDNFKNKKPILKNLPSGTHQILLRPKGYL